VLHAVHRLIDDEQFRHEMVEHNYVVGLEHFSHDVLRKQLAKMLEKVRAVGVRRVSG
jgi:hypothetical protein